jgi:hypothetical protein
MRKFTVLIKGTSPILLHKFALDQDLKDLDPKAQAEAVVYRDPHSNDFGFPSDMLYAAMFQCDAPKGKFAILPDPGIIILRRGNGRPFKRYEIDARFVVIEGRSVIRYRPRFDNWKSLFKMMIEPEEVEAVKNALRMAGEKQGLGDYRPPRGPFGTFEVLRFVEEN